MSVGNISSSKPAADPEDLDLELQKILNNLATGKAAKSSPGRGVEFEVASETGGPATTVSLTGAPDLPEPSPKLTGSSYGDAADDLSGLKKNDFWTMMSLVMIEMMKAQKEQRVMGTESRTASLKGEVSAMESEAGHMREAASDAYTAAVISAGAQIATAAVSFAGTARVTGTDAQIKLGMMKYEGLSGLISAGAGFAKASYEQDAALAGAKGKEDQADAKKAEADYGVMNDFVNNARQNFQAILSMLQSIMESQFQTNQKVI